MRAIVKTIFISLTIILLISCGGDSNSNALLDGNATEVTAPEIGTPKTNFSPEFLKIADLDAELGEISGMISIDGRVFAHNDTRHNTYLYELDATNGNILKIINIHNATNMDWEDMTQDDEYVYIGDIGNNRGYRQDLKIYKIVKSQLLNSYDAEAEIISFAYADQTEFHYVERTTPYDAEGLLAFEDRLYIFTKDWSDSTSCIYSVSKVPGDYLLEKRVEDHKKLDVMVTGATIEPETGAVVLVGYSNPYDISSLFTTELMILQDYFEDHFFSGNMDSFALSSGFIPRQYESVTFDSRNELLIASEGQTTLLETPASLYRGTLQ